MAAAALPSPDTAAAAAGAGPVQAHLGASCNKGRSEGCRERDREKDIGIVLYCIIV